MFNTKTVAEELANNSFEVNGTKELLNVTFNADKSHILREPKEPYQTNELNWFISQDRNIEGLRHEAGFVPQIWKNIADHAGLINSNYGWCALSKENGNQFENAIKHLELDKNSRRALLVYNRPSIHEDWAKNRDYEWSGWADVLSDKEGLDSKRESYSLILGDFMCCQNNHFIIRDNKLIMSVHMRSMDAVFGYNADWIWFDWLFDKALFRLKYTYPELERGDMVIHCDSLHVYERHYKLLDKFKKPEKSLEEEMMAKHIAGSNGIWIKQEKDMNKSFFTTPSNWASDIKIANFENPQNSSELKPYCSIEVPKAPFMAARENVFKKVFKHENALDKEDEAGEPAYFGSPSNSVHGGEPLNKSVDGIDITGESRYKANTIEHWDVAIAHRWDYILGCSSKYVYRNRFKGQQAADLKKIKEYAGKYVNAATECPEYFLRFKTATIFLEEEVDGLTDMELGMVRAIEAIHCAATTKELERMYGLLCAFVEAVENDDTSKLSYFAPWKKEMDYILTRQGL